MGIEIKRKHKPLDGSICVDKCTIEEQEEKQDKIDLNSYQDMSNPYYLDDEVDCDQIDEDQKLFLLTAEIAIERRPNLIQELIGHKAQLQEYLFKIGLKFNPKDISPQKIKQIIKIALVRYYENLVLSRKRHNRVMYTLSGFLRNTINEYFEEQIQNERVSAGNIPKICITSAKIELREPKTDVVSEL